MSKIQLRKANEQACILLIWAYFIIGGDQHINELYNQTNL